MKYTATFFWVCLATSIISCSKQQQPTQPDPSLAGDWKMTLYIDSTRGITETKAESYLNFNPFMATTPYPPAGDVVMKISFDDATELTGKIEGNTIFNGFVIGFSRTPGYQFTTNGGMWTLSMDPPWGQYFYNCMQTANAYGFDAALRLLIKSPSKTLVFVKQ
jgi:hypothetical protein